MALAGWTARVYDDIRHPGTQTQHALNSAVAIALYVLVSAVAIPTIAGLLLSRLIKWSERDGELSGGRSPSAPETHATAGTGHSSSN